MNETATIDSEQQAKQFGKTLSRLRFVLWPLAVLAFGLLLFIAARALMRKSATQK